MANRDDDLSTTIFIKVFGFIFYLLGRGIRLIFDVIVYAVKTGNQQPKIVTDATFYDPVRFQHMHIVGGTGWGKTQMMMQYIFKDIQLYGKGSGSIVVIDSQGDMIQKILNLEIIKTLEDRIIFIDPTDIAYPPSLNLFDLGLERMGGYTDFQQEQLNNAANSLFQYLFGSLLGAELTSKQELLFEFLASLMMKVPGANINTLLEFMRNPEAVRPYIPLLDPTTARFFELEYPLEKYNGTREQIANRLWAILASRTFERMFGSEKNKLNLFEALNRGSLILIYTAKQFLKHEDTEIFGRFFIALLAQAIEERAVLKPEQRKPTFVYIDECQDYFQGGNVILERLITQARKQHVGLILAHQNLDQLDRGLRKTIMGNVATKMVGGLSHEDAQAFAREFRCEPDFLLNIPREKGETVFVMYNRDKMKQPEYMHVVLGVLDDEPTLTEMEREEILMQNRLRISGSTPKLPRPPDPSSPLTSPELI